MADINFTHTDKTTIVTPTAGHTEIFYDTDGVLKQKDSNGFVQVIGTSGSTGVTLFSDLGDVLISSPGSYDLLYLSGGTIVTNNSNILSGGTDLFDIFTTVGAGTSPWEVGSGTSSVQTIGTYCYASGDYSVAEGTNNQSKGTGSHSEGVDTQSTDGPYTMGGAHSEGFGTFSLSDASHAEGRQTRSFSIGSHAEGFATVSGSIGPKTGSISGSTVILDSSYGDITSELTSLPYSYYSIFNRTDGLWYTNITYVITYFNGTNTFIDFSYPPYIIKYIGPNDLTNASYIYPISGQYTHAEGYQTTASGDYGSHSEGEQTTSSGEASHSEGYQTISTQIGGHAEGANSISNGIAAHSEGTTTYAIGNYSHSEGSSSIASGESGHAEGQNTISSGATSHAEGYGTYAGGAYSHVEGYQTIAYSNSSHTEGNNTTASGYYGYSHAEGYYTQSLTDSSHAEGSYTLAGSYPTQTGTISGTSFICETFAGDLTSIILLSNYFNVRNNGDNTYYNYQTIDSVIFDGTNTILYFNNSIGIDTLIGSFIWFIGTGLSTHAEGLSAVSYGGGSHAEGESTLSYGGASHAEGYGTKSIGQYSHAEGRESVTYVASEHSSANGLFSNIGDSQYTYFVRNTVVSDAGIGTKTTILSYPIPSDRVVSIGGSGIARVISGTDIGETDSGVGGGGILVINNAGTIELTNGTPIIDYLVATAVNLTDISIEFYANDNGSGYLDFYMMLKDKNTGLYDITASINTVLKFETLTLSTI